MFRGFSEYFDMGELLALAAPKKLVVVSGALDPIFPLDGAKRMVADAKRVYDALGMSDSIAHVIACHGRSQVLRRYRVGRAEEDAVEIEGTAARDSLFFCLFSGILS